MNFFNFEKSAFLVSVFQGLGVKNILELIPKPFQLLKSDPSNTCQVCHNYDNHDNEMPSLQITLFQLVQYYSS